MTRQPIPIFAHRKAIAQVQLVEGGRVHDMRAPTVGMLPHIARLGSATPAEQVQIGLGILRQALPTASQDEIDDLDTGQITELLLMFSEAAAAITRPTGARGSASTVENN